MADHQEEQLLEAVSRVLLDNTLQGIVVFSPDGPCLWANGLAASMSGIPAAELQKQTLSGALWGEGLGEDAHEAMATGKPVRREVKLSRSEHTGSTKRVVMGAELLGQTSVVMLIEDRTVERQQMDEAMRFTQYSVDHAGANIFWLDDAGRVVYASQATCERLGYTREEILSLTIHDLDPAAPKPWAEHWATVRERGSRTFEAVHRAKDGTAVPVEVDTNFVVYGGKEYHFSFARDISERKNMEESLRLAKFSLDRAGGMVFWFDSTGRFIDVSDATCETLGYSREEMLGMTINDLDPTLRKDWDTDWEALKTAGSQVHEGMHRRKDGKLIPVEVSSSFVGVRGQGIRLLFCARHHRAQTHGEEGAADPVLGGPLREPDLLGRSGRHPDLCQRDDVPATGLHPR